MKILVIEDDVNILSFLTRGLKESGHFVQSADNGEDGEYLGLVNSYDIIILDWMLPTKNGIDVLRSLREKKIDTPILMLSAKDETSDKIQGLKFGADDYLSKPFVFDELEARIEALYRRSFSTSNNVIHIHEICINLDSKIVTKSGEKIQLTLKEYELLLFMYKYKGTLISNTMIEEQLWPDGEFLNSNVVQVTIYNLKKKIGKNFIRNHRGLGYTFEEH